MFIVMGVEKLILRLTVLVPTGTYKTSIPHTFAQNVLVSVVHSVLMNSVVRTQVPYVRVVN